MIFVLRKRVSNFDSRNSSRMVLLLELKGNYLGREGDTKFTQIHGVGGRLHESGT